MTLIAPGDLTAPSFGPRMVRTKCGIMATDARPNWLAQARRDRRAGAPDRRHDAIGGPITSSFQYARGRVGK
jgi:hypothetical protein